MFINMKVGKVQIDGSIYTLFATSSSNRKSEQRVNFHTSEQAHAFYHPLKKRDRTHLLISFHQNKAI